MNAQEQLAAIEDAHPLAMIAAEVVEGSTGWGVRVKFGEHVFWTQLSPTREAADAIREKVGECLAELQRMCIEVNRAADGDEVARLQNAVSLLEAGLGAECAAHRETIKQLRAELEAAKVAISRAPTL